MSNLTVRCGNVGNVLLITTIYAREREKKYVVITNATLHLWGSRKEHKKGKVMTVNKHYI